jgi:exodeoxyribonuclease VII small subunit
MAKKKENVFEDSINRLQQISELLEKEGIELEESIKLYEEGIELVKVCNKTLKDAELKVTDLKKQLEQNIK